MKREKSSKRKQGRDSGGGSGGREPGGESGGGGGGFQVRDRSGKVHVIGSKRGAPAAGAEEGLKTPARPAPSPEDAFYAGIDAEPPIPTSHARDNFGSEERVFKPRGPKFNKPASRPESEVTARRNKYAAPVEKGRGRGQGRGGPRELLKLKATVDKNRKGFGFLSFEKRQYEDAFVPPREAETLFHGDRVEVSIWSNGEVEEIKVLAHRFRELTGRYAPHPSGPSRGGWVIYERKKAREEVFAPATGKHKPNEGDWVRVSLQFHEEGQHRVTAEILEVYGPELPPSADVGMIANEYNLIEEHPEASEKEARETKLEIPGKDLEGREDLRDVPFITIDGETARDFDDAVYVERVSGGYVLWVAIADVSHYVKDGTALDQDARSRGTSVYFPERAFHMLPRALSENLCSLRPNEPRLTLVSRMEYDKSGKRTRTEIMEAVIQSKRRATYNEIQAEWDANRTNSKWEFEQHFALYQLIRKARAERGSIDFDLPEAELLVEKTGEVISIKNRARVDAHRLIEEFMISANEAVTEWAMERQWPFVYRVHDVPALQSLEKFQTLAANVGVNFSLGDASPKVMAELVKRLEGHPAATLLNTALLRSMKQAIYSSEHGVHFGLASEGYTHFTSPIRRYPDLVVHRVLRQALRAEKKLTRRPDDKAMKKLEEDLADVCEHCSYRERLASDAERESIKLKQVRLMQKHLGDEFKGKVNGMTENGLFIQLEDPFVEGMIHKDSMTDDLYQFNDERMVFYGKRKKRTFQMGSPVQVRVARADIDRRMIDFELLDGGKQGTDLEIHGEGGEKPAREERGGRRGRGGERGGREGAGGRGGQREERGGGRGGRRSQRGAVKGAGDFGGRDSAPSGIGRVVAPKAARPGGGGAPSPFGMDGGGLGRADQRGDARPGRPGSGGGPAGNGKGKGGKPGKRGGKRGKR